MASNEHGIVVVATTSKHETYAINGTMVTVKDALKKFFGSVNPFTNNELSLDGHIISKDTTDAQLRAGDVILAIGTRLASGGVKGA
ncbi:hypothetical protein LCGC14_0410060 [marine sediment metagenome]|uniref:Uncharacterized protein n=1 Tax=marine sediment metagenome TaxID=412755 RepID=A0A0F9TC28_9ZZZZ